MECMKYTVMSRERFSSGESYRLPFCQRSCVTYHIIENHTHIYHREQNEASFNLGVEESKDPLPFFLSPRVNGLQDHVLPGAGVLLQLFTSEISIRGQPRPGRTGRAPRAPWRVRCVLERLSLSGLVSVACGAIRGPFPKLLCNELTKLREMAKDLAEDAEVQA